MEEFVTADTFAPEKQSRMGVTLDHAASIGAALETQPLAPHTLALPSCSISIPELLELYGCDGSVRQYLRLMEGFLSNAFSIYIAKKLRHIVENDDKFIATLGRGACTQEPDPMFRFFHLLPEVCILSDNALGPDNRLQGICSTADGSFGRRMLFRFLKAAGASPLETAVFCVVAHINLKGGRTPLFAGEITNFLPKSLFVKFMASAQVENTLTAQQLVNFSEDSYINDQVLLLTQRSLDLLSDQAIDLL